MEQSIKLVQYGCFCVTWNANFAGYKFDVSWCSFDWSWQTNWRIIIFSPDEHKHMNNCHGTKIMNNNNWFSFSWFDWEYETITYEKVIKFI